MDFGEQETMVMNREQDHQETEQVYKEIQDHQETEQVYKEIQDHQETEQVYKEIQDHQSRTENVELHPRLISFLERDSSFLTPWNWNPKEYLPFSPSYFNTHHYMKFQLGSFYLFNNDLVYLIHNKSDELNLREQVLHPVTVTEIEQEGSQPEEADSEITHQDSQPEGSEENIVLGIFQ